MNNRSNRYLDMLKEPAPYSRKTVLWFRLAGFVTLIVLGAGYYALYLAVAGRLAIWLVMLAELVGVILMVGALALALKSRQYDIARHKSRMKP